MSESSASSSVRELAQGIIRTPLGTATVLSVNIFLERALPHLPGTINVEATATRLKRTGKKSSSQKPVTLEGRWRGFGQDPAAMKCDPRLAFRHFPDAVSAIIKASCGNSNRPCKSTVFQNNPVYVGGSYDREKGGLPNAYLLLGGDATWANVVASGEYKKTDNKGNTRDNIIKVTTSMAECMCRDPRRRFTFAYTIENTTMRLWYCDRWQIIASEAFNFITDREPMIHFFLSLTYAEPCQLGLDPTMTPLEDGRNFDIRVDGLDGVQRVYRTLQLLSRPGLYDLKGKGTRVWKAVLVEDNEARGEPVVLKDAWVEPNRKPEGYILDEIRALPVQTATHSQDRVAGVFPTLLSHGYVFLDPDRKHLDHIPLLGNADRSSAEETPPNLPLWTESPAGHSTVEEPAILKRQFRVHYRIVLKEVGKPISQEQSLTVIYKMLAQIAYALHHLHLAGWVHRDVSPGNILIVEGRGVLIDLEYARKEGHGKEYRMGTPGFLAVEVELQTYCLQWAAYEPSTPSPKEKKRRSDELARLLWPSDDDPPRIPSPVILPKRPPPPKFRYNALHDLESLWWVAVYFIVQRRVVDGTQELLSPEDMKALVEQRKWAHLLFDNNEQRYYAIVTTGIAENRRVLHPAVQPIVLLFEDLLEHLWTAYVEKEKNPEVVEMEYPIHQQFMTRLRDLYCVSLMHIKLLPLPSLVSSGIPDAPAPANRRTINSTIERSVGEAEDAVVGTAESAHRGTKRSASERAEHMPEEVQERPTKQARLDRAGGKRTGPVGRTRPYLPRKVKPLRNTSS